MHDSAAHAIGQYIIRTGNLFDPEDEIVEVPTDALVFASYQQPWPTLEEFKKARCNYDPETNDWLIQYVTDVMLKETSPIFLDIRGRTVYLVDGAHRVTAHLIAGRKIIRAQLNRWS